MSRLLAQFLGHDEKYFGRVLTALEKANTGEPIDVGLIGDIHAGSAQLHRSLGLDPVDTTARELYALLRSRVDIDNKTLAQCLGGKHADAASEMMPLIATAAKTIAGSPTLWVLKTSVAKKILRTHPPRQLQRELSYRSVESMLKREPVLELMTAARYTEDEAWQQQLLAAYATVTPADFEDRALLVSSLAKPAYSSALAATARRHHWVLHSKEMGTVYLVTPQQNVIRGYTIKTLSLISHSIGEIRAMNTLLAHYRTDRAYGRRVVAALRGDATAHTVLAELPIHWRAVHRYGSTRPEARQQYGEHADQTVWQTTSPNHSIAALDDTLAYWRDNEWLGRLGSEPVGFNLVDLSIDASEARSFDKRSLRYVRRAAMAELIARYMDVSALQNLLIHRINRPNTEPY